MRKRTETHHQQVNGICIHAGSSKDLVDVLSLPLWESGLEVGEPRDTRPDSLIGCSESSKNAEKLVDFTVTRKESSFGGHFNEDAANGPDVDRRTVKSASHQDLWRSVPESDDFMCVGSDRETDAASKTEISQFDVSLRVNQQVLWFEITMKDTMSMTVSDPLKQLPQVGLDD